MLKKKTTKSRTWNKSKPVSRRRAKKGAKAGSGRGRYLLLIIVTGLLIRYGAVPAINKVKAHPVFTVRSVEIDGTGYLDSKEVLSSASVETGGNIFEIDIEAVSSKLKEKYAAEDFTVYRRLPDTIAISVSERQPVALLNMKKMIGVDANGVPLPYVGASMIETLPIVSGVKNIDALNDPEVQNRLKTGLKLLGRISSDSPSVYNRISELDVSTLSEMGITMIDNGLEVIIGPDEWARKLPSLEKVINKFSSSVEKIKAVDIRYEERVFVRKR